MYKLYYAPGLASLAPHFVLNEIGAPYELILVDRKKGEHQSADYLALNPNGRIPTLVDGDLTLFEAAAICLHLADRHPDSGLIAAPGSRERALTYQWLTFLTNTVQVDFWQYYRPEFYVSPEDEPAYRARMEEHLLRHLAVLDTALQGRRALAGEQPSIADFYLLLLGAGAACCQSRPAASPISPAISTAWSNGRRYSAVSRRNPSPPLSSDISTP